jgi:hypothetical protein
MDSIALKGKFICLFKESVSDYYDTFYSRKAAPPICIFLCLIVIISYALSGKGTLF